MHVTDPLLPPLLAAHSVKAPETPFAAACRGVACGRYGAADLIYARNTALAELALVLEPDVARSRALQMLPLFQLCVIEALGSVLPPQTSVLLRWPGTILVNGGEVGRFDFAIASCTKAEQPAWMVLGAQIALMPEQTEIEPGHQAHRTCLVHEGLEDKTRTDVVEAIASYFLSWLDTWHQAGFGPVHDAWVGRVEGHVEAAIVTPRPGETALADARVLGFDEDLNLLVRSGCGEVSAWAIEACLLATDLRDGAVACVVQP